MTTPMRYIKHGRPIDVVILNEFWNRVWTRLRELNEIEDVECCVGTMFHHSATALSGAAISGGSFTNYPYGGAASQGIGAINNEFKNSCFVMPGLYELRVLGSEATSRGIVSWYLNDVLVGTQDWYAASPSSSPVMKTITDVPAYGGWITMRGKIEAKHASSSGYSMSLIKYSLVKVG